MRCRPVHNAVRTGRRYPSHHAALGKLQNVADKSCTLCGRRAVGKIADKSLRTGLDRCGAP